ncbi:MAG TPA: GAF domain-containing protein [Sphingomonas sp.]|jgi:DNA-binding NarL/FixJ family response regulator
MKAKTSRGVRLKNVLIVDSSVISRMMVESILADSTDFRVVGAIGSSNEVVEAVDDLRPDVIVIDLSAPESDGERLMVALKEYPVLKKVVLSAEPVSEAVCDRLSRIGADAFFDKKSVVEEHEAFREGLRSLWMDKLVETSSDAESLMSEGDVSMFTERQSISARHGEIVPLAPRTTAVSASFGMCHDVEAARLEALRALNIANDTPDRRLDLITQHLRRVAGYPMVAVTLIDESVQWIKAASGLDAGRTSREEAFCAHTIECTTPLIVSDAREHPVFSTFDCVVGSPHIRSYVGMPLLVEGGLAIGAVCLMDTRPRLSIQGEILLLSDMAELIVEMLDCSWPRRAA